MENLFYDYNIDSKFDLKGSVRNRLVDPNNQNGEETVLLDENLIQSKFYIKKKWNHLIESNLNPDWFAIMLLVFDSVVVGSIVYTLSQ